MTLDKHFKFPKHLKMLCSNATFGPGESRIFKEAHASYVYHQKHSAKDKVKSAADNAVEE